MRTDTKLMVEARELIDEVRVGRSLSPRARTGVTVPIDENDAARRAAEDPVDGCAVVVVSDDAMTASVTLYPPHGFGRPLNPGDIIGQLHEAGVVFGIREDLVEAAVFTCNTERSALYQVEVAFGTPARDEVPEYLELHAPSSPPLPPNDDEPVNHRARSTLPLVEHGAVLAVVSPQVTGATGKTVTGQEVPHQRRSVPTLQTGENVKIVGHEAVAAISGLLHTEAGVISVRPTLQLTEGVGYHTGTIDFDGDVVLGDRVADGFSISCSGALASAVTIDSYGMSCGALVCSAGVIGHGGSDITIAGDASLRFVQSTRIGAGGTIRVVQSIFKSHVTAHDRVEVAHGSTIVGSTIRAGLGAEVFDVGGGEAAASEFYLGIDFAVDARLATIRDQTLALSAKLRDVRLALSRADESPALLQLERDLQLAIAALADEAGELVSRLDRDEDASLVVHGSLHPGTYVEICHRSHLVEHSVSRCTFRLDRKTGGIAVEPLGAAHKENTR